MTLCDLPGNSFNSDYPWVLTYDAWNRLVYIDDQEGHQVQCKYDG
jgi:YD repeat-containing protein